ncbi:SRPBCC family protein [Sediminicola luteus]|uniref:Polyketide cyclase n=1 Tax=Sediminicola luteus TaxID=319238 RepID=A0A2A4GDW0_9FLAO|nr:SRPBCC family protein [Sediminicola luteus]PCE66160.1 polyketide cyclase [Sediminicola luteus]
MLKKILIVVGVLIAAVLLTGIIAKKEFSVERTVVINKPKQEVFDYVKMLKNQDNYAVWQAKDPNTKKSYTGTDGTVGFISAWESEHPDVGHGEQEITAIKDGERIDYELRFLKPYESTSPAYMVFAGAGSETTVSWGFQGKMPFPMNLMLLFTSMEADLGDQLNEGLQNLKNELE